MSGALQQAGITGSGGVGGEDSGVLHAASYACFARAAPVVHRLLTGLLQGVGTQAPGDTAGAAGQGGGAGAEGSKEERKGDTKPAPIAKVGVLGSILCVYMWLVEQQLNSAAARIYVI